MAAPPGTPDDVVKILADAFEKVHKDPEVRKKMDQNGSKTEFLGPEASLALVKKKMVEYEAIMKALGESRSSSSPQHCATHERPPQRRPFVFSASAALERVYPMQRSSRSSSLAHEGKPPYNPPASHLELR